MSGSRQPNFAHGLPRAERIARLNDALRKTGAGGRILVTCGVRASGGHSEASLLQALAEYHDFDPDNDPHGERDFGGFDYLGAELLWKIDYYDNMLTFRSDDPADPSITVRILTIMLAEEY